MNTPLETYSTIYLINISIFHRNAEFNTRTKTRPRSQDCSNQSRLVISFSYFFFFSSSFYPFSHRRGYATSTQRYDTNIYKQLSLPFIFKMADTTWCFPLAKSNYYQQYFDSNPSSF